MDKNETQHTQGSLEETEESKTETEDTKTDTEDTKTQDGEAQKEPAKTEIKKTPLEEKEKEVIELKDSYLRLQAETENFKRRMREEKAKDIRFANERLIKALLPLYENLGRALAAPEINIESLKLGVDMIFKEFTSFLEKEKVKPIPTVGETFDPTVHEALSQLESSDYENETVVQEISKGFLINDRVLRPASVVISKKPLEKKQPEFNSVVADEKLGTTSITEQPSKTKNHNDKH